MTEEKKEKKPLNLRALKGGSYSLVLCAVVLAQLSPVLSRKLKKA